jgi:AraC-like DNA-binding protein
MASTAPVGPGDGAGKQDGHLVFMDAGLASVTVEGNLWALAPHRALWVPHGATYTIHKKKGCDLQTLGLAQTDLLPTKPRLVEVAPFMRALIHEAVRLNNLQNVSTDAIWINQLLISRIDAASAQTSLITAPADPRLRRICEAIIDDPANNQTIDEWVDKVGMSRRTLTRRFREEMGISFSIWRQQVRLQEALIRLEMGEPVSSIALDVGYEWPTSFSTVFRQTFGASPSHFINP